MPDQLLNYATGSSVMGGPDCFRRELVLWARSGAALPRRCLLCGHDAETPPLTLKFTWDESFKITRLTTLRTRDSITIHAHLCPLHFQKHRRARMIGLSGIILSGAICAAGALMAIISESLTVPLFTIPALTVTFIAFAMLIVFAFVLSIGTRTISCVRIENNYGAFDDVSPELLKTLPAG